MNTFVNTSEKLSNIPWVLLRQVVEDVKSCIEEGSYIFNMRSFLVQFDTRCEICLAGALIAKRIEDFQLEKTFYSEGGSEVCFSRLNMELRHLLYAIDAIRSGNLDSFLQRVEAAGFPSATSLKISPELDKDLNRFSLVGLCDNEEVLHFCSLLEKLAKELEMQNAE